MKQRVICIRSETGLRQKSGTVYSSMLFHEIVAGHVVVETCVAQWCSG